MSREHHKWRIGKPPPTIRAHSLAKHRVLRSYLETYVAVLTSNPRQTQFKLTLVDGFAGGGRYLEVGSKEERPGSPLIMLQAMKAAAGAARAGRRSSEFNLDVEYFFIEKDRQALEFLHSVRTESEFRGLLDSKIRLIQGEFVPEVPRIVEFVKNRGRAGRVIWVVDQFGYLDAPLPTIGTILAELDNAEVILTIATDFLIDYLNDSDETQERMNRLGMVLPSTSIRDAKIDREWRRIIQFLLYKEIPQKTGAAFYTPFFIRSPESHRDFWLIHLSGHYRARGVMVGLHWQESTSFAHYGRSGLRMLGYDPKTDREWTKQNFLPGFYFDQTALVSSQEELLEQLPKHFHEFRQGITFADAFAQLTNDTPVTAEIMKEVIRDLAAQGVLDVRDSSGLTSRRAGVQHDTDVIFPSRQKRLFLPRGGK